MSIATSEKPTARIFDRNQAIGATSMPGRTRQCWKWGDAHGFDVLDEHVAWGANADLPKPPELVEAVELCASEGSTLIVYCLDVFGGDPHVADWVRGEISEQGIAVATGPDDGAL